MSLLSLMWLALGVSLGGVLMLLAQQAAWRQQPPQLTPQQREQRRAIYSEWARAQIDGGKR